MDNIDKNIIHYLQQGIPVADEPFRVFEDFVGCDQVEIVTRIQKLLDGGFLSRFGPMYNLDRMGGWVSLVAIEVPEERFEQVAEAVNRYSEVAHNYHRDHRLNMWFVIGAASEKIGNAVLQNIEDEIVLKTYSMPKSQEYFVGLFFHLLENKPEEDVSSIMDRSGQYKLEEFELTDLDKRIIFSTQEGLPLSTRPFSELAGKLQCSNKLVNDRFNALLDHGWIRRIATVPNHYKLGYTANAMTVWNITDTSADVVGKVIGGMNFVSHCYRRPRYDDIWEYNVFAMVHGRDEAEVENKIGQIKNKIEGQYSSCCRLNSKRILKKTGLRFQKEFFNDLKKTTELRNV